MERRKALGESTLNKELQVNGDAESRRKVLLSEEHQLGYPMPSRQPELMYAQVTSSRLSRLY